MSFRLEHWIGQASALTGRLGEPPAHQPSRQLRADESEHARALAEAARALAAPHGDRVVSVVATHDLAGGSQVRIVPMDDPGARIIHGDAITNDPGTTASHHAAGALPSDRVQSSDP